MRLFASCLFVLLVLIQYPLWFGKGGELHVKDLTQQLNEIDQKNAELQDRNVKLSSEVQDLKDGKEAVEERARYDLGMIKQDEIFVQILSPHSDVDLNSNEFEKSVVSAEKDTGTTQQKSSQQ